MPIECGGRDRTKRSFAVDEHPRRDTSMERLATLKVLHPEIAGFSITAGNAAGANDGAAAMVIAADDVAAAPGLEPLAVVRSWASVGERPSGVSGARVSERVDTCARRYSKTNTT